MSRTEGPYFSTKERALAGAIVTLANQDTGETRVIHTAGYFNEFGDSATKNRRKNWMGVTEQLRELLSRVDTWNGNWKVRSISNPQTILGDIRGRKPGGASKHEQFPLHPEAMMLGYAGRIDMWERGLK